MKIILEYKKPDRYSWNSFTTGGVVQDHFELDQQLFYGRYCIFNLELNGSLFWGSRKVFRDSGKDTQSPVSYATESSMYYFDNVNPPFVETREYTAPTPVSKTVEKSTIMAKLSFSEYKHLMEYVPDCADHKAILATGEYLKSLGNEVCYFCFQ